MTIKGAYISGPLRQTFCNGLCQKLTAEDIGPVECQQPGKNEKNCPDINPIVTPATTPTTA